MEKISAFGYSIYKFSILDDNIEIPSTWTSSALREINKPEVRLNQSCNLDKGSVDDQTAVWSTFETPANSFFSFKDSEVLLEWVTKKVVESAPHLGFTTPTSAFLTIDWMNVMYKGSFGNCHTHSDINEPDTRNKVVAIFYLSAPKDSADLLVLENTRQYCERGISPFSVPQDEMAAVSVSTGDLIVHKVDLPHAVSEHLSNDPRLCLVMEFRIE
jgi:hypothetical protein